MARRRAAVTDLRIVAYDNPSIVRSRYPFQYELRRAAKGECFTCAVKHLKRREFAEGVQPPSFGNENGIIDNETAEKAYGL